MYKTAEVRGVLAAFCDAGLVKVASADAFDDLTEKVAYCLNDCYTVDDVADAASYVIKLAEDAKKPSFLDATKNKAKNFRNAAKNYVVKNLGFGDVGKSIKDIDILNRSINRKKEALIKATEAAKGKMVNGALVIDAGKEIKRELAETSLQKTKSLRNARMGRLGKNLLKSLGKTSVHLLALYGGGKLLGGLFGSDKPEYY